MRSILDCTGYELCRDDVVRAEGAHLITAGGDRIVDFESGVWCAGLGHAHPRLQAVMHAQLDRALHLGYRVESALAAEAAEVVLATLPLPDGKCVFLASGSEAVELATQIARRLSGKPLLLGLAGAYLSAYGTTGTTSSADWVLFDGAACAKCPHCSDCDPDCPRLAEIPFERISAFVFEPGNSGGLVKLPPRGPVRALASRVTKSGGFLVVDEVTTGLGRTGAWYGFQHYDLRPDLVALGKGLGNGYPVSAVAMRRSIGVDLEASGFHYAQSHQNDPLGCAVAKEVLAILRDERLVERSAKVGEWFLGELEALAARHDAVRQVRGRGLMLVMEFDPDSRPSAVDVHRALLGRGFLVGCKPQANLLRFYPPLVIEEEEIRGLLAALDLLLGGTA
ncbi:MAG: aminotransferase class III-fold pyridoxal phosphate-dependent enzyme [Candidatus Bipolaricaulota bacterium]|nr:aminotransferase class III-fold pyridoxal phosphate-dependent enzyme [Candidatus Bipolaricaulota bacterium]